MAKKKKKKDKKKAFKGIIKPNAYDLNGPDDAEIADQLTPEELKEKKENEDSCE